MNPLQHKLSQYEETPPSSVWEDISSRLGQEYVASDTQLSDKLTKAAITPPADVWSSVRKNIHPVKASAKVLPFRLKRMAAAAVFAGALAFGGMYLFTGNVSDQPSTTAKKERTGDISGYYSGAAPYDKQSDNNAISAAPSKEKDNYAYNDIKNTTARNLKKALARTTGYGYDPDELQLDNVDLASLNELHTVPTVQPVSVSAPPIRDARGNIIMDMRMISKPNTRYIVVTSPNGTQTKISRKFLSCLSYINNDYTSSDTDINPEEMQCKNQFREWRDKLLSEAAFIPSVNNFFDIFELQDLFEDRQ